MQIEKSSRWSMQIMGINRVEEEEDEEYKNLSSETEISQKRESEREREKEKGCLNVRLRKLSTQ